MKKLMFSLMMLVAANVMAEDNHLYIQSSTGETLDWSVPSLQKMTFQIGNVVITMKNGTSTYTSISSVNRMYICTPSVNGIESVEGDGQCIWDGERLHVNAPAGSAVKVYSVNGVLVSQTRLTDTSVDLQGLNRGMYVVNVGGQVVKIMKK